MSLLSLVLRNGPVRAIIGTIQLDASISESHELSATPTRNAIEDGSVVSDHIMLDPEVLTLDGLISAAPVSFFTTITGTAVGLGGNIISEGSGIPAVGTAIGAGLAAGVGSLARLSQIPPRTTQDVRIELERLRAAREPFEVLTGLKIYANMVITRLTFPRNAKIGRNLRFSATFEEIVTVSSSTVKVAIFNSDASTNPSDSEKLGKQSADTAKEKTGSDASFLLDGLTSLFGG